MLYGDDIYLERESVSLLLRPSAVKLYRGLTVTVAVHQVRPVKADLMVR